MSRALMEDRAPAPVAAPLPDAAEAAPAGRWRPEWGVLWAGAVLVAAAGALAPDGLRPFTTLRWAVVGVAAALAAASARGRPPRAFVLVGGGFLAWVAVATALAVEPVTALVGHPRRHLGLAGWVVCALAFLAGTGLRRADVTRWLARAAVVAAGVTGVGALTDLAGWDPAGVSFAGGRIGGLLGQPTYLAALALLLGPVAAAVACDPGAGRGWRPAAVAATAGCGVALAASQTRGAWVALAVAFAFFVRIRLSWGGFRTKKVWAVVVLATALLLTVGHAGARVTSALDGTDGGLGARADEWALAARAIADRPVTGAGPEGYRIVAPAYIDEAYTRRHGREEVVDRAHSAPLDVAAAAGLLAAGLYVALLALVVARCARAVRRPAHPVVTGMAVSLVAWVVQQLVAFPIAEVDPVAWLLAGGLVVATGRGQRSDAASAPPAWPTRVVAGACAALLAAGGVLAVAADRHLGRAEGLAAGGRDVAALAAADRATGLWPHDIDAWYVAARVAAGQPGLLRLDAGIERVQEGRERFPRDPALRDLEEALLVERALRSGLPEDRRAAEAASRAAIAADPSHPDHHRRLGLVLDGDDTSEGSDR
jgi:O-antigen ligase